MSTKKMRPLNPSNRVLPIMAASRLAIMLRGVSDDQCHFHGVAQADQAVTQFSSAIKSLDLIPQMTQLANRAGETVGIAREADVVPHDVLNRLHIALNQSWVGIRF